MNIVLAPHIDDEVIGLFSLLKNREINKVYYFFDIDEERKKEALKTAQTFDFEPVFVTDFAEDKNICSEELFKLTEEDTVYAPSSFDLHKDHLEINKYAKLSNKGFNLLFYSIDMNRKPTYLGELSQEKKRALNILFPSQIGLFNSDEKYFLFEDIHKDDSFKELELKITDNQYNFTFKIEIIDGDIEAYQFKAKVSNIVKNVMFMRKETSLELLADDIYLELLSDNKKSRSLSIIIDNNDFKISSKYKI